MKKEETIRRYGEAAYEKKLAYNKGWNKEYSVKVRESNRQWRINNPEKVKEHNHVDRGKGGKYHEQCSKYALIGLPYKRKLIRNKHWRRWTSYKRIIAPGSQLHHEWIPGTADFRGVALVEAYSHRQGFIDVIQILEGEITLSTEAEIRGVIERNG